MFINSYFETSQSCKDSRSLFFTLPTADESFLREFIAEPGYCLSPISYTVDGLSRGLLSIIFDTDDENSASCRFDKLVLFFRVNCIKGKLIVDPSLWWKLNALR